MARKLRGNTTMGMVNAGIAERNSFKPKIGTTITMGTPIKETMIGSSYGNIVGGSGGLAGKGMGGGGFGGGFGGGLPSMGQLEASSMRLADAASRRNIAEKEAEMNTIEETDAKKQGFSSVNEMQYSARRSRQEQEREEKQRKEDEEMRSKGYVKIGGEWVRKAG